MFGRKSWFVPRSTGKVAIVLLLGCASGSGGASQVIHQPEPGERHLRNIRQLTFSGNNAEAYFSRDGKQLIFQRQERVDRGCDQQSVQSVLVVESNVKEAKNPDDVFKVLHVEPASDKLLRTCQELGFKG